jgi:EcoRII C terminal
VADGRPQLLRKRARVGIRDPIAKRLVAHFRSALPSNDLILRAALESATRPYAGNRVAMEQAASDIFAAYEKHAYEAYLESQRSASVAAFTDVIGKLVPENASKAGAVEVIATHLPALDEFFLSVAQGRKKRAGGSLDSFFENYLAGLGYRFAVFRPKSRRGELVFPSLESRLANPSATIVLMTKRVLREAGSHISASAMAGGRIFVATVDQTVGDADLARLRSQDVVLVVPLSLKKHIYADAPGVISIEHFIAYELARMR